MINRSQLILGTTIAVVCLLATGSAWAQLIEPSPVRILLHPGPGAHFGNPLITDADVNGDGTPDLITATGSLDPTMSELIVFSGRDGSIYWRQPSPGDQSRYWYSSPRVLDSADYNQDGRADVFISEFESGMGGFCVRVYSGAVPHSRLAEYCPPTGVTFGFQVGDFNGDQIPDLFLRGSSTLTGQYLQVLSGTDWSELFRLNAPSQISYDDLLPEDVDRDGYDDVVSVERNRISDQSCAFAVSGRTGQPLWITPPCWTGTRFATGIAVGDVTGDGENDIVLFRYTASSPTGILMAGGFRIFDQNGTFIAEQYGERTWNTLTVKSLADFDRDGKVEIVAQTDFGTESGEIPQARIYTFDGSQFHLMYRMDNPTGGPDELLVNRPSDLNGDGFPELHMVSRNYLLRNFQIQSFHVHGLWTSVSSQPGANELLSMSIGGSGGSGNQLTVSGAPGGSNGFAVSSLLSMNVPTPGLGITFYADFHGGYYPARPGGIIPIQYDGSGNAGLLGTFDQIRQALSLTTSRFGPLSLHLQSFALSPSGVWTSSHAGRISVLK